MVCRGVGGRGPHALVLAVAAVGLLAPDASAQEIGPPEPPSAEIDPTAPLDAMPDLGVDWPDLDEAPAQQINSEAEGQPSRAPADDLGAERRYSVVVTGLENLDDPRIRERFDAGSTLQADRQRTANAAQLDRRARADAELLGELLRARGYYDAVVTPSIGQSQDGIEVRLAARPGSLYRFSDVRLPGIEQAGEDATALRQSFAVQPGEPVIAEDVIAAGVALKVALGRSGYALAEIGEQDIEIDDEARTARLVLPVSPGPVQQFGQITVTGKPPFSAAHVQRIARFKPGERFRQSRVDDLRRALIATGLVASAEVRVTPAADGRAVNLQVHLEPAPMRTIAGELGYGTGEGARAEASWQHRNFFNPEGALTVRGVVGTQEQLAAVSLRRNNFRARDQALNLQASAGHVDRKAYEARTLRLLGSIERQSNFIWQKSWTWSIGAELIASDERDTIAATGEERRRTFFIGAIPGSLTYDGTDDLLDPTQGFRLGGRVSPELSMQGSAFGYVATQVDASAYRSLGSNVVGAGRVRLGSILGAERDRIAPSRRFYSGGGGSVRGYGYQRLGPRDVNGDPIGGRSLAEFSLETRVRFGTFGVVPFLDGGTLSTGALPSLKDWQFGVGLGARYYSSFGPIRIDVGTPLNRQDGDSRIAVTVSLGQAF
ncbi:autotransporter assembly complex protein TamA [Sphingomonas arenae]|uniref:autotransporter assembly complex protein TamA n=1 Tax=Sphingomonas arenae TaxID=2812555 RepID=UPI00196806EE|nr:BamA/TamA family outer membrane protein [Sphingomonas arenae]